MPKYQCESERRGERREANKSHIYSYMSIYGHISRIVWKMSQEHNECDCTGMKISKGKRKNALSIVRGCWLVKYHAFIPNQTRDDKENPTR